MYWKTNSIGKRLSGFFLLVILIPTIIFSILIYLHQKNSLYETKLAHLEAVANLKENAIKSWLIEEKYLITLLANQPFIQQHGTILLTERPASPVYKASFKKLQQHLRTIPTFMSDILSISILSNIGGRTVISTDDDRIGQYHLADSFFTLGRNKTYVQRMHYSASRNDPALIIATPLKSKKGKHLGVLYVALEPKFITSLMKDNSELGKTGKTYLVDTRQHLVTPIYKGNLKNVKLSTHNIKQGLNKNNGYGISDSPFGNKVLSVYRWLEEPKVALLTEMELIEIHAPLQEFLIRLLLAAAAVILLAFSIAYAITNTISKPIEKLTNTARQITNGNLGMRVSVKSDDEIGILSKAFNEMTDSLQQNITDKDNTFIELQKTINELEQATLAKSAFLTNMSHELRTPLHAIIGFSQLMVAEKNKLPSNEWLEYINTINTAGNHLLSLISDLLDLSRIETGALDLMLSEIDTRQIINDVIRIAQPLAEKNGNELHVTGLENAEKMLTDSKRLQQILLNLLGNSAKFTEQGSITLNISTSYQDNKEWFCFAVSDTGIGIGKDELATIFEKFNQADSSYTRKYEGSGLGLTISKYLCESMGGSIEVESEKDKGTEFIVRLPRWAEMARQEKSA